jgi:hypothetical protein
MLQKLTQFLKYMKQIFISNKKDDFTNNPFWIQ